MVGMAVADEDGIGISCPFDGLLADVLLFFRGAGSKVERQTKIEENFGLSAPYLDAVASDFVSTSVDDELHMTVS